MNTIHDELKRVRRSDDDATERAASHAECDLSPSDGEYGLHSARGCDSASSVDDDFASEYSTDSDDDDLRVRHYSRFIYVMQYN